MRIKTDAALIQEARELATRRHKDFPNSEMYFTT